MVAKDLIVAIEIGSSSVIGAAGYKRTDGTLEVVACACEPAGDFIHNGVVKNIDKTAQCLTDIVNRLEGQLADTQIDRVYVGLGGYTLHTVTNEVEASFDEETRVTAEIKERLENENETKAYTGCVLVHVIPHGYTVDSLTADDPVGYNCTYIRGMYLNMLMRHAVMENLAEAFRMANTEEADDLLMPLLLSERLLSDSERQSGCALVDVGAETTTVAICKDGALRSLSVIPIGSRHISGDLMTAGIAFDEAEELKRTIGITTDSRDTTTYTTRSGNGIKTIELTRIMKGRFEEILANVRHRIEVAGYGDGRLIAGTVFTGGGMAMAGAADFVRTHAAFARMRVTTAATDGSVEWTAAEKPIASRQLSVAALLAAGTATCCTAIEPERPKDFEFIGGGSYTSGSLFDDDGESAQAKREAEEAKRREEEKKRREEERQREQAAAEQKPQKRSRLGRIMRNLKDKAFDLVNEDNDQQ